MCGTATARSAAIHDSTTHPATPCLTPTLDSTTADPLLLLLLLLLLVSLQHPQLGAR
jgi:hypothetical protein